MSDYFESNTISSVLAWLFSIPFLLVLVIAPFQLLFNKFEGIPRLFVIWVVLCMVVLGPFRYVLLQLSVAIAYPVQSLSAFLSTLLLAFYIPIVFGFLYAVGLGFPALGILAIAGTKEPLSKVRLTAAAIAAPLLFLLGSYLYFLALPYAAYSTHWLSARDAIRATNGLPEYLYTYIVEPATPLQLPGLVKELGYENLTAKERLRAHVATIYLGDKEFSVYVSKSYPNLQPKQ